MSFLDIVKRLVELLALMGEICYKLFEVVLGF